MAECLFLLAPMRSAPAASQWVDRKLGFSSEKLDKAASSGRSGILFLCPVPWCPSSFPLPGDVAIGWEVSVVVCVVY